MLLFAFLLAARQEPSIDTLTSLAKKKDISGLARYSTGDGSEFRVFKGGSYEVGKLGWSAAPLHMDGAGDFVVFTTPLTSEDIGELLFQRVGSKLKFIDEQEKDGLRLRHHSMHVQFNISEKRAMLMDSVTAEVSDAGHNFHALRFSPCYKVSSITDGTKAIGFRQTGGIVMIPKMKPGKVTLHISYNAYVDLPNYAGSIGPNIATLTNDYWYPMVNRMPTTYDITVVPPGPDWTIVAQGNHVGRETGQKQPGEKFDMPLPTVYWSLTALKTKHVAEKIDGRILQMWSPRVSEERMALQPKLYAPIIKLFDSTFAPFPFASYGALDSPVYGGGALEAYSYATYGGGLPTEDPHEPSHTWWGGILPNTYLKSFWNESFANWSVGYFEREVPIGNPIERRELFQTISMPQDEYNHATLMNSGVASGTAGGSLGYGKGALVLAMLEQLVGTNHMLECCQEWIRSHPKGEPAEWEEFESVVLRKLLEFNLKDFFDDWFRRPGYASVNLVSGKFGLGRFGGKLEWVGPKFRMPLDFWFEDAKGNRVRKTLDTKDVDSQGNFTIEGVEIRPVRVYMDPYHRALRTGLEPTFDSFADVSSKFKVIKDPKHPEYFASIDSGPLPTNLDLDKKFLIGNPATMPMMKELCEKVGFMVDGDNLTYDGTTIDLKSNAAVAIVDLGGGKQCAIALGVCQMPPNIGVGYLGLVDNLGRTLRGRAHFPGKTESALKL